MQRNASSRRLRWVLLGALVLVLALAAAWRWTPLQAYAHPRVLAGWLQVLRDSPWAPLAVLGLYLLASATLFPNTVLNLATVLGFGTTLGPPMALGGSLTAAVAVFLLGRRFGERPLRRLRFKGLQKATDILRRGGVGAVLSLRLLPVAPFAVVNFVAGAARVRVWAFVVGSLIGFLPGILMITAFGHQLRRLIQNPQPEQLALLAVILVVGVLVLRWLQQRLLQRHALGHPA